MGVGAGALVCCDVVMLDVGTLVGAREVDVVTMGVDVGVKHAPFVTLTDRPG